MKSSLLAAAVASTLLLAGAMPAQAAQNDILVRARALNIQPDVSTSGTLSTIHTDVGPQTVPELDFTYMVMDHVGVELILGTARHKVTSDLGTLGRISHLPPTLTLQYHFNPTGKIRPYAGVGVNYTRFYDNDLHVGDTPVSVKKNSFGPALQIGVDVALNERWFLNADVKKLWIKTDASMDGQSLGTLKINPWLIGVGIGYRF